MNGFLTPKLSIAAVMRATCHNLHRPCSVIVFPQPVEWRWRAWPPPVRLVQIGNASLRRRILPCANWIGGGEQRPQSPALSNLPNPVGRRSDPVHPFSLQIYLVLIVLENRVGAVVSELGEDTVPFLYVASSGLTWSHGTKGFDRFLFHSFTGLVMPSGCWRK